MTHRKMDTTPLKTSTAMVPLTISFLPVQVTLFSSALTSFRYVFTASIFSIFSQPNWQARRDSNPQHPDLESGALPIRATGLHS